MNAQPPVLPTYLHGGIEPAFGLFHAPAAGLTDATAILICPPFGWEDICSYRSRRDWAEHLAAAGHPVLRIDLPGAGDSSGSARDEGRLSAWTSAVASSAQWLHDTTASRRVAAIGISLGGLVICKAIFEGAPIDEAVLWGVPARGHTFVRELRAFARLEKMGLNDEVEQSHIPQGATWAGGFLLSAETTQALETLDLRELTLPPGRAPRVLLLDRDGIGPDGRLHERLTEAGVEVTVAPGGGYGAMMAKPHLARSPTEVFERVLDWLEQPSGHTTPPANQEDLVSKDRAPRLSETLELSIAGTPIRETPLTVEQPFGSLFGILTEPAEQPRTSVCAVALNAGAIRRIGPNRMWVEFARRWAARGVPTLRLDLEGLGDADGDAEAATELEGLLSLKRIEQISATLDALQRRGLGPHFVLVGLCSGSYWSFHAALRDQRVRAALMLNLGVIFWDPTVEPMRELRGATRDPALWRGALRGEIPRARIVSLMRWVPRAPLILLRRAATRRRVRRAGGDELDHALDRLRDSDKRLLMAFSGNEPLHRELDREGRLRRTDRWPNLELALLPGEYHTLRQLSAQQRAHEVLDRALERELRRATKPAPPPTGVLVEHQ